MCELSRLFNDSLESSSRLGNPLISTRSIAVQWVEAAAAPRQLKERRRGEKSLGLRRVAIRTQLLVTHWDNLHISTSAQITLKRNLIFY